MDYESWELTWDLAHSRTVRILSWSGWKHIPTLPMGWGSVMEVGKLPSQSSLPNSPFHWLCRLAVLGRHQGIKSTTCPVDNLTCISWILKQAFTSRSLNRNMQEPNYCCWHLFIWKVMPISTWPLWNLLTTNEIQLIHFFWYMISQDSHVPSNSLLEPWDRIILILSNKMSKIRST